MVIASDTEEIFDVSKALFIELESLKITDLVLQVNEVSRFERLSSPICL